jgi:hypothetical protein
MKQAEQIESIFNFIEGEVERISWKMMGWFKATGHSGDGQFVAPMLSFVAPMLCYQVSHCGT